MIIQSKIKYTHNKSLNKRFIKYTLHDVKISSISIVIMPKYLERIDTDYLMSNREYNNPYVKLFYPDKLLQFHQYGIKILK